jgi:hypothetical protein
LESFVFLFICNNIHTIVLLSFEFESVHCVYFERACIGIMKLLCTCILKVYILSMNKNTHHHAQKINVVQLVQYVGNMLRSWIFRI